MQQNSIQQNVHLLLSSVIVITAALVYGLSPSTVLPKLFDFQVQTPDLSNVFRAIMGLYLAFACFWVVGILRPSVWKAATLSQILFMGGLGVGRSISLYQDGLGSLLFSVGTLGEIVLCLFGVFQYLKYRSFKSDQQ